MKKLFVLSLFFFFAHTGYSQTLAQYVFTSFTSPYVSISGTGTQTGAISCDDCGICNIPIGFYFVYCGTAFNILAAQANGYLSLANNCMGGIATFKNSDSSLITISGGLGMLMPYWDDLLGFADTAYYSTTGTPGNRIFTFEWKHWNTFTDNTIHANFQVKLHEGSNIIDFCYGPSDYNGRNATIGIANGFSEYLTLPNTNAAPVPSAITFTDSLTGSPANGQVYRWRYCAGSIIEGLTDVCLGASTTLTDTVAGGTWNSSNSGIATIDTNGIVTSVAPGSTTITYTTSLCEAEVVVTVDTQPMPGTINGGTVVCTGINLSLTDSIAGGSWICTNANAVAGYGTGIITGINLGSDSVIYTVTNACGDTAIMQTITIEAPPDSIMGGNSVCIDSSISLSDNTINGTWSSINSNATVGATSGIVSGVAIGVSEIMYTLAPGCYAAAIVIVNECAAEVPLINNSEELNIFPNPVATTLFISYKEAIFTVTISNLMGEVVYRDKPHSQEIAIDMTALPTGIYFIKINGIETRKFVKQ